MDINFLFPKVPSLIHNDELFLLVFSDDETYMSADDLRINLWNLEITNQSFNIVDIKPANMEDLTEVITAAEFDPTVRYS